MLSTKRHTYLATGGGRVVPQAVGRFLPRLILTGGRGSLNDTRFIETSWTPDCKFGLPLRVERTTLSLLEPQYSKNCGEGY